MSEFFVSYSNIAVILLATATILSIVTFVFVVVNFFSIRKVKKQLSTFLSGKDGASLEEVLLSNNEKITELDSEVQELFDISNTINKQAHKGIHKIGMVRFNPFGERAGNQSFALALLNTQNNGLVMSSLHTREGTRVYTKQVKQGKPVDNQLTQEEEQAIQQAK